MIEPDETVRDSINIEEPPDSDQTADKFESFLTGTGEITAVGHRFVHGGHKLTEHSVIDAKVREELSEAVPLDVMHMKPALRYLDRCRDVLPAARHVACLDTAFHANMPEVAKTYPVPHEWRDKHGVRRFGFHGLSHAWAATQAGELLGRPTAECSFVSVHLGGGASACTIRNGQSVWSSMGFSPLEGLMMSTRSGSIDPSIVLWLQQSVGLSPDDISEALHHRSGLLGLSDGLSGDTRVLVRAARGGNASAQLALDVFCLRTRQEIAAAAVSLERLDGLIFTGEIGADQPEIRQGVTAGLGLLGIDTIVDLTQESDRVISSRFSKIPVVLVHPREDLQIAREVRKLLDH